MIAVDFLAHGLTRDFPFNFHFRSQYWASIGRTFHAVYTRIASWPSANETQTRPHSAIQWNHLLTANWLVFLLKCFSRTSPVSSWFGNCAKLSFASKIVIDHQIDFYWIFSFSPRQINEYLWPHKSEAIRQCTKNIKWVITWSRFGARCKVHRTRSSLRRRRLMNVCWAVLEVACRINRWWRRHNHLHRFVTQNLL